MENLFQYLTNNKIRFEEISSQVIQIADLKYLLVQPNRDEKLFNEEFQLIVDSRGIEVDRYVFQFGGIWYWTKYGSEKEPQLNRLKYLGLTNHDFIDIQFPFLGVRGQYEVLNGSRLYDDWIKKAKFLDVKGLGICEKNTLAGILSFQINCRSNGIDSIIGMTATVDQNDYKYDIKLYTKNIEGWRNLLLVNKEINVTNPGFIYEKDLLKHLDGLVVVLDPKSLNFDKLSPEIENYQDLYYQLDTVEYENDFRDRTYLLNFKRYIDSNLRPVAICDAFYLDREDSFIKEKLNQVQNIREYKSENQYFKDVEDYFIEVETLFKNKSVELFDTAVENVYELYSSCDFVIDTKLRHLPEYRLSEEEKKKYNDKYDLFWGLIEEGLKTKPLHYSIDRYIDRIESEYRVIEKGDILDYFLILYDIINWARSQGILVGIGRGSAGGSVITYILGITFIDPLRFNLLFERFLNEGRLDGGVLPDIDVDFSASRRDEVKRYMEERYGVNQVCSIGTYTTLQLKAALRELCRLEGVPAEDMNYFSTVLDIETGTLVDIFRKAVKVSRLKKFIKDYPQIINTIDLILGQPKAASVHACATLILPQEKDIYSWIPVKTVDKDGQNILVSEWEGEELESAGFLKEDILGIQQLDKFQTVVELVRERTGEEIDIYTIPLDDLNVYEYFRRGWNADVFHFGSQGLTQYCKELKPDNIEDLIAGIALYRPGSMESGFHKQYIELREGKIEPEYDFGLEEVTKNTYGLYIYQEQIMEVYQKLGEFTLVEADDIRRAMGKMKEGLIDSYGKQFIETAVRRGCPREEAEEIQRKAERFAHYSFNRCISGDERLYRFSTHKSGPGSFRPTIREMFMIKNDKEYASSINKLSLHTRYQSEYGSCISLNEEGRLIKNKIKDIRFEGEREIYRVLLENDKSIDVTINHKFPTSNGEKRVDELEVGVDRLYFNVGFKHEDTSYRSTTKGKSNSRFHSDEYKYEYILNSEKGREGFQKRDTPFTRLIYYEENLKKDYCEDCSNTNIKLEVHHEDQNNSNNDPSNLVTLCVSCHKKRHYKLGRTKMGERGLSTELLHIKSIEFLKIDDVYDVEMEAPYHTFTNLNGIVTCNSHAGAYAITGYICQYLKIHYPLYFWIAAFKYLSEEDKIPMFMSEIFKTGDVIVSPPNINLSGFDSDVDYEKGIIYWKLSSIKQCGEKSVEQIVTERNKNGQYFTFSEFFTRHKYTGSKVNKAVVENLITSGAFDEIADIKIPKNRVFLISEYRRLANIKPNTEKDIFSNCDNIAENWWWLLQQKRLSGHAFFDFKDLVDKYLIKDYGKYIHQDSFFDPDFDKMDAKIGGYIIEVEEKFGKRGSYGDIIIDSNYERIIIKAWPDEWELVKGLVTGAEKSLLLVSGKIGYDSWKKTNVLFLTPDSEVIILE